MATKHINKKQDIFVKTLLLDVRVRDYPSGYRVQTIL